MPATFARNLPAVGDIQHVIYRSGDIPLAWNSLLKWKFERSSHVLNKLQTFAWSQKLFVAVDDKPHKHRFKMKQFLQALLLSFFVSTHVNSILTTTKPLTTQPLKCNVNNNNYNSFFAGPNCKKIETMFSELEQHVTELKEGVKEIKGILNGNKPGGKGLSQLFWNSTYFQCMVLCGTAFQL